MSKTARWFLVLGGLAVVAGLVVYGVREALTPTLPRLTEEDVREAVVATIEREAPEAFVATGRLSMTVTTRVGNTKTLLPGIIGLDLGTTRATVRVPGRVVYGFEADSLRPSMVRMLEDGSIEVEIPPLAVLAVEVDLSELAVETERGWARIGSQREQVERRALTLVEETLRAQAVHHLRTSYQSRVNAARAVQRLLGPALAGLGMADPQFRFRLGDGVVILPAD